MRGRPGNRRSKGAKKSTRSKKSRSKSSRARAGARKSAKSPARRKTTARKKTARKSAGTSRRKSSGRKSVARKTGGRKAAAKKSTARKSAGRSRSRKDVFGEGNYTASREFRREQTGFVRRNRDRIPQMGAAAEEALEGNEGEELREAEDRARSHSHAPDEES